MSTGEKQAAVQHDTWGSTGSQRTTGHQLALITFALVVFLKMSYNWRSATRNFSLCWCIILVCDLPQQHDVCFCSRHKVDGCLTVHLPHEITWNANLMWQGNFINIFLVLNVSGKYAHHQEHWMLSCSIWFSAPSFWMGGGLESRCVGRVYGADGAVRRHLPHRTHDLHRGSQGHHPSKNSVQKTICCNSTPNVLMMGVCTRNMSR